MPIHGYPGNVITANPTAPTSSVASGVWTTEQQLLAKAAGNWPFTIPTQQISRSLRFNTSDSTYLSRTPASAGNRKTWTWSVWVKRSTRGSGDTLLCCETATGPVSFLLGFDTIDRLYALNYNGGYNVYVDTAQIFRDFSAWYHIVLVVDTTQATSSNRLKFYVNGSQVTSLVNTTYPTQNSDLDMNLSRETNIGRRPVYGEYFGGYMTEINFIDGQALTPSSFGRNNIDTGVWEPLAYTGTYGTNGFYLNFSDNSGTTSTTLGKDSSGNGNNWTPNNFSVTAGSGNDSLVDSPTSYGTDTGVGGEVRGNYCTFNPLNANSAITLSNGNLTITQSNNRFCGTTIPVASGKWYFEYLPANTGTGNSGIGVIRASDNVFGSDAFSAAGSYAGVGYLSSGNKNVSGTITSYGATYVSGDVIGVAIDLDSGTQTITFYKNNTSQGSINIPTASQTWMVVCDGATSVSANINFGQRAFAYTAPSGFKALCTQNLPTPTIGATSTTQADNYFGVALYSGTGSGNSNVVSGLEFTTDLWWQKARNAANNNYLQDAVRGFGASKSLTSNSTGSEGFNGTPLTQSLSVSSTGFTVSGSDFNGNTASETYVAWCWNAGGSTVTNTSGTISSQVRASTTAGFSIVTWTGNGVSNSTVGHGLGVTPAMIILKDRDVNGSNANWFIWHQSLAANRNLFFTTGAVSDITALGGGGIGTSPTSSVFTLANGSSNNQNVNENTDRFVAYCFAAVAGYSAFGSFTGNGSADGPFVYLGFRPAFVMAKLSSATGDWNMVDDMRQTYNDASGNPVLRANLSSAEEDVDTMQGQMDLLSNGFKLRSNNSSLNLNGGTIIYAAFAENPFKYALAR